MSFLTAVQETRFTKKKNGSVRSDATEETVTILPIPLFVVKTKIETPYKDHASGTKIFINVCSSKLLPLPDFDNPKKKLVVDDGLNHFDPAKVFPLIANGSWEIPILTSPSIRDGHDKKGTSCLIIDCVINHKASEWCSQSEPLKNILIEWCFDAVEFFVEETFIVDRDSYVLPKRASMGDPVEISVGKSILDTGNLLVDELYEKFQKNDALGILEAKRFEEEESEIKDLSADGLLKLFPNNELPGGKSGQGSKIKLIEEIESTTISENEESNDKASPAVKENSTTPQKKVIEEIVIKAKNSVSQPEPEPDAQRETLDVEKNTLKSTDTKDSYKYKFTAVTHRSKNASDYILKYDSVGKSVVISSRTNLFDSKILEVGGNDDSIQGLITAFYVKPENKLYIFIK